VPVVILKEYERKSEGLADLFVLVERLSFTTVVFNKSYYVFNHIGDISLIHHFLSTYLFVTLSPLSPYYHVDFIYSL